MVGWRRAAAGAGPRELGARPAPFGPVAARPCGPARPFPVGRLRPVALRPGRLGPRRCGWPGCRRGRGGSRAARPPRGSHQRLARGRAGRSRCAAPGTRLQRRRRRGCPGSSRRLGRQGRGHRHHHHHPPHPLPRPGPSRAGCFSPPASPWARRQQVSALRGAPSRPPWGFCCCFSSVGIGSPLEQPSKAQGGVREQAYVV